MPKFQLLATKPGRPSAYLFALILIVVLLSPAVYYIIVGIDFNAFSISYKFAYFALCFLLLFVPLVFLEFRIFFWISILYVLPLPLEIGHLYLYQAPMSSGLISAILHTNLTESFELLSGYFTILIAALLLIIGYIVIAITLIPKDIKLSKTSRQILLATAVFMLSALYVQQIMHYKKIAPNMSLKSTLVDAYDTFVLKFSKFYPYSIIYKYNTVRSFAITEKSYLENTSDYLFGASKRTVLEQKEIYVFVIGETSRYDHWSINGYERKTNPLLELQPNVLSFSDMLSCANITSLSLPFLITKVTPQNQEDIGKEKSFIQAFKEAGFATYWISNQNVLKNELAQIADADTLITLNNEIDFDQQYDENVFPLIDRVLANDQQKILIVVHTMGSHFRYNFRYPLTYDKFKPSFVGNFDYGMMNPSNLPTIVNTYDNSILYTDFVLSSIIDKINDKQAVSFVMYVADHGENLGDDGNELFFHGTPFLTKAEMHVPFIIWNSDSYKNTYPEKIELLTKNKEAKLSTNLIFHTILDMADIGYPNEQVNLSPANSSFEGLKERWVLDANIKPMKYD